MNHTDISLVDNRYRIKNLRILNKNIPTCHVNEQVNDLEDVIKDVFINKWNFASPKFIFNIIQENFKYEYDPEFISIFVKSYCKLAQCKNCWTISNGLKLEPIVSLTEQFFIHLENIRKFNKAGFLYPIIGVFFENEIPYENITNVINLTRPLRQRGRRELEIDSFFSHFLILKSNVECSRLQIFKQISSIINNCIPVFIFICGDITSIDTLYELINSEKSFLIIENSGGLAKFLFKIKNENKKWKSRLNEDLRNFFQIESNDAILSETRQTHLKYIFENLNFSHFLSIKDENSLLNYTLKYLTNSVLNLDNLQTAVECKNIKLIKDHITWMSEEEISMTHTNQPNDFLDILVNSILNDDDQLLRVIFQSDIEQSNFLTSTFLRILFMKNFEENSEVYFHRTLKRKIRKINIENFFDRSLIEQQNRIPDEKYFQILDESVQSCFFLFKLTRKQFFTLKLPKNNESKNFFPLFFFWSILSNKEKIANCILQHVNNPIQMSLVGFFLSKNHAHCLKKQQYLNEAENSYKFSTYLENFAVKMLENCYERSRDCTHVMLMNNETSIFNISTLELARKVNALNFLNTRAFQSKLSRMWTNPFHEDISYIKVIICIFLPILIPLIQFKSNESNKTIKKISLNSNFNEKYSTEMSEEKFDIFKKYFAFYNSPITKYFIHLFFFLFLLGLLSYTILTYDSKKYTINKIEVFVICSIISLFFDEFREFFQERELYMTNSWNILDFLCYSYGLSVLIVFLIEITLSPFPANVTGFFARFGLSIILIPYYLKIMPFLFTFRRISIQIIMIFAMAKDLLRFLIIFFIFGLAYGIIFRASLVVNTKFDVDFFIKVFLHPFYFLIADIPIDLEHEFSLKFIFNESKRFKKLTSIELGFLLTFATTFLIISSILLFNVLTAMFTTTYEKVKQNSEKIYGFLKYDMVSQFKRISIIPGPFMIINNFMSLSLFLYRKKNPSFLNFLDHDIEIEGGMRLKPQFLENFELSARFTTQQESCKYKSEM